MAEVAQAAAIEVAQQSVALTRKEMAAAAQEDKQKALDELHEKLTAEKDAAVHAIEAGKEVALQAAAVKLAHLIAAEKSKAITALQNKHKDELKESESRHRSQLEQMSKLLQFSTVKTKAADSEPAPTPAPIQHRPKAL